MTALTLNLRRISIRATACLAMCLFVSLPATRVAAQTMGIVATVNNAPISQYDLQARLRLTIALAGLPRTAETARRLAPKIVDTLIDEELKRQEAEDLGIKVTDAMVDAAIRRFERARQMKPGEISALVKSLGLSRDVLDQQVRADIAWSRAVRQRFRSQAQVTETDIDEAIALQNANKGKPISLLSEIFLPIDKPSREAEVRAHADQIIADLRNGAPFNALAASFSQSPTASVGGDLGWVSPGSLPPEAAKMISQMKPGRITPPIRTVDGYYIYLLRDRRISQGVEGAQSETKITLQQLSVPVAAPATPENTQAALSEAETLRARATNCEAMSLMPQTEGKNVKVERIELKMKDLSPAVHDSLTGLADGQVSKPVQVPGAVMLFMICKRETVSAQSTARKAIRARLVRERLGLSARQYLRDLRRNAFIERR